MMPAMLDDVEIAACNAARDGELIRTLTRDNFYEAMKATWDGRDTSASRCSPSAGGLSTPFSDCRFCERQTASFDGNC